MGMDAIANCANRKASHCPKLVNWAKLGPDKILDSDLFAFIEKYFYPDFRFVFLDSRRFNNLQIGPKEPFPRSQLIRQD